MLLGLGQEPRRRLPGEFQGTLPPGCSQPVAYLPGTLVVQGTSYVGDENLAKRLAADPAVNRWPVIILVDDSAAATESMQEFLWTVFTRFEPAADIHGAAASVRRFHVGLEPPVVFDCRMKPWYTEILETDEATRRLVDSRYERLIPRPWR
jgi:hypothetical protein